MIARRPLLTLVAWFATVLVSGFTSGFTTAQNVIVASPSASLDPYASPATFNRGAYPSLGAAFTPMSDAMVGGVFMPVVDGMSDRLWLRAEYLYWFTDGMQTPALVTSSPPGTPRDQSAFLGPRTTDILFGETELNDGEMNGGRIRGGFWINQRAGFALEGEGFGFETLNEGVSLIGSGDTILGRPFFNTSSDQETAQLISFPGAVEGGIAVDAESSLASYLINGRVAMMPLGAPVSPGCRPDRVDWIFGFRRLQLDDDLVIRESINSLVPNVEGQIAIEESFRTENRFNGLQLGIVHQANMRRASLESVLRLAIGSVNQVVDIRGNTVITEFGVPETFTGGLLAQTSNIGRYERDELTIIPEVGFTLGIRLTDWLDANIGYSVLYLPNVVRAGQQIDRDVNPALVPEALDPLTGSQRPTFVFVQDDYFAHGFSLGGEIRF